MSKKDSPDTSAAPPSSRNVIEQSTKLLLHAERELNDLKARTRREAKKLETVLAAAWRLRDMPGDRLFEEVLRLFVEELDHDRGVVLSPAGPGEYAVAKSVGFDAKDVRTARFAWAELEAAQTGAGLAELLSRELRIEHCLAGLIPYQEGPLVLAVGRSAKLAQFLDPLDESDRKIFGLLCSHVASQIDNQRFIGRLRAEHERLLLAHKEIRAKAGELGEARRQLEGADRLAVLGEFLGSALADIRGELRAVADSMDQIEMGSRALGEAYKKVTSLYRTRVLTAPAELLAIEVRHGADRWTDSLPNAVGRAHEAVASLEVAMSLLTRFSEDSPDMERRIDLGEVARGALHLAKSVVRGRASAELEADATPKVAGDMPRLMQVVLNLLMNAVQAMPPHRPPESNRIHVGVRVAPQAGSLEPPPSRPRVVLSVEDNGLGIDPAVLGRIFEPFFTTKPPGVGTGLGLAVSRRIVEEHGGSLAVVSRPGSTRFDLTLPAAAPTSSR